MPEPLALHTTPPAQMAFTRRLQGAATLVTLLTGLAVAWWHKGPLIATASLVGQYIVAHDASGREAWRYRLPHVAGDMVPGRLTVPTSTAAAGR